MAMQTAGLSAQPAFIDRSATVTPAQQYAGGWSHFVGGGVAVFDCNDDGLPDIFAAGGETAAGLYVNTSTIGADITFAFRDSGAITGVTGAYPIDFDNDAVIDLAVMRNGQNMMLRGEGDCRFSDATAQSGLPPGARWTTAFAAVWEDDNTRPTYAIGNYVDATNPEGPFGTCDTNWLARPDGDGYRHIPLDPGFCPLSMLFSDWQRQGTPTLRISNDRQYYVRDGYEQMWSLDPLRAWDESDGWQRLQLWGMGIASHDITGDGLPEIMLTSMGDQMLMENTGGGFATVPFTTGTFAQRPFTGGDGRPSTGWHAEFADVDNDGRADLFIAKGNVDQMPDMAMLDPNNLLMQQPDGTFAEMADVAGIASTQRARGAGFADLNDDGRLDLVVVNRRAPLEVWQNATDATGNWVRIDPRQDGHNRFAIGAFVEVRTGDRLQTRERTIGGGHVSGALVPLHFGIADAQNASFRVIWPDGTATGWQDLPANRTAVVAR